MIGTLCPSRLSCRSPAFLQLACAAFAERVYSHDRLRPEFNTVWQSTTFLSSTPSASSQVLRHTKGFLFLSFLPGFLSSVSTGGGLCLLVPTNRPYWQVKLSTKESATACVETCGVSEYFSGDVVSEATPALARKPRRPYGTLDVE